jgi:hypothetical protein
MRCRIDHRRAIPPRLHRLDAGPGLRPDVPDPLLRLLAQPERAAEQILHVLAIGWNLSRSSVLVSGRDFVRPGNRKASPKNLPPAQIARTTIRRGAEIFAFGLLFRLQEYLIAWGWAPLSDLLRVDVLNTIGLSMMLMGVLCWLVLLSAAGNATAARSHSRLRGTALIISLLTPPLWTTWRPDMAALAAGSLTSMASTIWAHRRPGSFLFFPGLPSPSPDWRPDSFCKANGRGSAKLLIFCSRAAGLVFVGAFALARCPAASALRGLRLLAHQPKFLSDSCRHAARDPDGELRWCRWGAGRWGFSPLIQLGQASLLVYWVHLEFVYGRSPSCPNMS